MIVAARPLAGGAAAGLVGREGSEMIIGCPARELAPFERLELAAGEFQRVLFQMTPVLTALALAARASTPLACATVVPACANSCLRDSCFSDSCFGEPRLSAPCFGDPCFRDACFCEVWTGAAPAATQRIAPQRIAPAKPATKPMELFANPRQVRMQTNASRTGLFRYARERRRELGRAAVAGRYCHPFPSRPRGNVLHRAHRKAAYHQRKRWTAV